MKLSLIFNYLSHYIDKSWKDQVKKLNIDGTDILPLLLTCRESLTNYSYFSLSTTFPSWNHGPCTIHAGYS